MTIKISQNFDSGAIEVLRADSAATIELNLRKDSHADIHQWFHFRLQGASGQACVMRFLNAGQATYARGYEGYNAVASYDGEYWFRVPTSFDGEVMTIAHTPERDSVYYAYFEPYSFERHLRLLGEVAESAGPRARSGQHRRWPRHEPGRHRQAAGGKENLVHRAPASGRSHGRMVHRRPDRRAARRRQPDRPQAAAALRVLHRAEHEPGRLGARQPAHQRGRRQPQSRVDDADRRAQPGSAGGEAEDARNRRRHVLRHPRRRGAAVQLRGR